MSSRCGTGFIVKFVFDDVRDKNPTHLDFDRMESATPGDKPNRLDRALSAVANIDLPHQGVVDYFDLCYLWPCEIWVWFWKWIFESWITYW